MFSYWSSSFLFDFMKLEVVCITCICTFEIYNTGWDEIWNVLIPAPLALVLFCYAMSFCFNSKEKGLITMLALHHIFFYIVAFLVAMFRLINAIELYADNLSKVLRVFPSYPISNAIYYSGFFEELQNFRDRTNGTADPLPDDILDNENMGGDVIFVWIHIVVWTFILFVLELSPLRFLRRCCHLSKLKPSSRSEDDTPIDVKFEEENTEQC